MTGSPRKSEAGNAAPRPRKPARIATIARMREATKLGVYHQLRAQPMNSPSELSVCLRKSASRFLAGCPFRSKDIRFYA